MLLIILASLMTVSLGWATDASQLFKVKTATSTQLSVRAFYYTNQYGSKEIRLESPHLPRINERINSIYGYGRDIDEDGKIDTWFMLDPKIGFRIIEIKCKDMTCSLEIENNVFKKIHPEVKGLFYSAYAGIFGYLFSALNNRGLKEIEYFREWIDLSEMGLIIKKELSSSKPVFTPNELYISLQALNYGHEKNQEMITKAYGIDNLKYNAIDGALVGAAGTLFKFLGKGLSFAKFQLAKLQSNSKVITAVRVASITQYQNILRGSLLSFKSKIRLLKKLNPIKNKLLGAIKNGAAEWKYIGLNATIQLSAEVAANYHQIKDDDPIIMAKNVMNDEDIQQNISYMASETFMMAAAVSSLKSGKAKFAACAFIAITNSTIMNLFLKDEVDPKRVALDTSWEVLIGGSQVQLDLAAISYFQALADKTGNQKLKFLGYAVVLVNQGVGYYAYSNATKYVEDLTRQDDQTEIVLLPVHAVN